MDLKKMQNIDLFNEKVLKFMFIKHQFSIHFSLTTTYLVILVDKEKDPG